MDNLCEILGGIVSRNVGCMVPKVGELGCVFGRDGIKIWTALNWVMQHE